MKTRCAWCSDDPLYQQYHDKEWGVPLYDDQLIFEALSLEIAQAGLSWFTILQKRENYRQAFDKFGIAKIANYSEEDVARLMANSGIIRNRLKITATINNAQKALEVQQKYSSLAEFFWSYVDNKPIINTWQNSNEVPCYTPLAIQLSKDLKKLGFKFIGPTICYSFMQAIGMVNDHTLDCFIRNPDFTPQNPQKIKEVIY